MPEFQYLVLDADGNQIKGTMEATDIESVKTRLKMEGLTVVSVKKVNIFTKDIEIKKKVKHRDLSVFCRQFSSILSAGVPVVQAINILCEQTENETLRNALKKTAEYVRQGMSLAEALAKFPDIFPEIFVHMVNAGEKSGSLDVCVTRMGIQFEKDAKLSGLIKKAMIYPIIVFVISIAVLIIMSVFVVPKFSDIFTMMGADLPLATRMIMALSDFLIYKWYILVAVVVAVIAIIRYIKSTDWGKEMFSRWALKFPLIGQVNVKTYCAKFARTMSTLVSSGLGITFALEVTEKTLKNVKFKEALIYAKSEVEQGVNLSKPLKRSGVFPPMLPNMLAVGEETGNVEGMLDKVAEYYEEEAEIQTGFMTEAMQPAIIVILGIIVGIMVLSLYQPMINVYRDIEAL